MTVIVQQWVGQELVMEKVVIVLVLKELAIIIMQVIVGIMMIPVIVTFHVKVLV